ncbi:hypothetical protein Pmani_034104 [Petrolisthes manimaculis]|uniref:Apple domain-containing protein n=1 Tax=Petrolisthes manimaculis TaxID=1843537 RepID=A0AAE1NQ93_9EUCA|nr:hypothetical protein Pmani_034104 [Petrolisthes manimaculis]
MAARVQVVLMVLVVSVWMDGLLGDFTADISIEVYPGYVLPESSFVQVLPAASFCKCRVMCQTLPNCTSSSRYFNDKGEQVCGLSEEPYPPPTFILNLEATTVIIPSRVVYPPTTTTTTPPPARVWISAARTYDGTNGYSNTICGTQGGVVTFIPDEDFVNRLVLSDDSDMDVDLDETTGIWISLSYDMTAMKHLLYDGSYFEDAPEFSKFTFTTGDGDCFCLKANMVVSSTSCTLYASQPPRSIACMDAP